MLSVMKNYPASPSTSSHSHSRSAPLAFAKMYSTVGTQKLMQFDLFSCPKPRMAYQIQLLVKS